MNKIAIIGSRETPEPILVIMRDLIKSLAGTGTKIRSGGAGGADHTVTEYASKAEREIFLPWNGFADLYHGQEGVYLWSTSSDAPKATKIALKNYHWVNFQKQSSRNFHSRNAMQVLGYHLDDPVDFVLCWTPGGNKLGGTATGIKIAESFGIPVYNLGNPETLEWFKNHFYKEE